MEDREDATEDRLEVLLERRGRFVGGSWSREEALRLERPCMLFALVFVGEYGWLVGLLLSDALRPLTSLVLLLEAEAALWGSLEGDLDEIFDKAPGDRACLETPEMRLISLCACLI